MSRALAYYAAQRVKPGFDADVRSVRAPRRSSAADAESARVSTRRRLARLFSRSATSATSSHTALQGG